MTKGTSPLTIKTIIESFSEDFSHLELDKVMDYFSDQAVYKAYDGQVHVGRKQIRQSFQRLFDGAFGIDCL